MYVSMDFTGGLVIDWNLKVKREFKPIFPHNEKIAITKLDLSTAIALDSINFDIWEKKDKKILYRLHLITPDNVTLYI